MLNRYGIGCEKGFLNSRVDTKAGEVVCVAERIIEQMKEIFKENLTLYCIDYSSFNTLYLSHNSHVRLYVRTSPGHAMSSIRL